MLCSSIIMVFLQGRWLMLTEELGQLYQAQAPVPLWFRYLLTYQEVEDGATGLTLGVLLALLYLILKVTPPPPPPLLLLLIFISPPFCSYIGAVKYGFSVYGLIKQ